MKPYETIEMEVLLSIDKAFHEAVCNAREIKSAYPLDAVGRAESLAEWFKAQLPAYVDNIVKGIKERT